MASGFNKSVSKRHQVELQYTILKYTHEKQMTEILGDV